MVKVATMTSKGQVTLPRSIRERLGLRKGSRIVFLDTGEDIRVIREEDLERKFAIFERRATERGLTRAKLRALVKEAKRRLWTEHYARRH